MKRFLWPAGVVAVFLLSLIVCEKAGLSQTKNESLVTSKDSVSYIIGTDIAKSLMSFKSEIVLDQLVQGISDQLDSATLKISPQQAGPIMQQFNMRMQASQMSQKKAVGEKNLVEGKKFLEENKARPEVKTTSSGLQYIILAEGKGPKPQLTDKVKVHYKGELLDGTEFDNSISRGQPLDIPVQGVIKGWSEALQLMSTGSKFKLFIPSELGYGERGAGQQIGPNAVLVFEVELIEILKN